MRFLVVMDPVESVREEFDTSFALMLAAQRRGHRVEHCLAADVFLADGHAGATVRVATMMPGRPRPIALGAAEEVALADLDVILVRTDPPFDADYLTLTLLLEHVRDTTFVLNDPRGLRDANEKLYACRFPELMPATIVSAAADRIIAFIGDHAGGVVKPIDGHGGHGIVALMPGDVNTRSLIAAMTNGGRRAVMVQQFLPRVREGDKRILLLDGEALGAILRIPAPDDFRANIGVGGSVQAVDLDDADRSIIDRIGPALRRDGLWFVGIDVIAGLLTEVNVTSPTGLRQLGALTGTGPDDQVISWIESEVQRRHTRAEGR